MAAQRAQRAVPIGECSAEGSASLFAARLKVCRPSMLALRCLPAISPCAPCPVFIQGSPSSIALSVNGTNSSATIIDDLSTCQNRTAGEWFANYSTAQELLWAPQHCNVPDTRCRSAICY